MSVVSAIRDMLAKGMPVEQALLAAEIMEASLSGPKSNAQRQAEWRERQKAKRNENNESNENNENVTAVTASRENKTTPTHAEPEPNKTTSSPVQKDILTDIPKVPVAKPKSADAMCVAELGKVLDPEHARAVVEHRNRLRKPMTARGAALLANSLSQAPDPNAAADEMIERGWQGWKADWGRSHGPPGRVRENSLLNGIEEFEQRFGTSNVQQFPRIAG